jgi:hypothetical protein
MSAPLHLLQLRYTISSKWKRLLPEVFLEFAGLGPHPEMKGCNNPVDGGFSEEAGVSSGHFSVVSASTAVVIAFNIPVRCPSQG